MSTLPYDNQGLAIKVCLVALLMTILQGLLFHGLDNTPYGPVLTFYGLAVISLLGFALVLFSTWRQRLVSIALALWLSLGLIVQPYRVNGSEEVVITTPFHVDTSFTAAWVLYLLQLLVVLTPIGLFHGKIKRELSLTEVSDSSGNTFDFKDDHTQ